MVYQGDRIKKEKEALDLIIKMKKKDEGSHTGELIMFVIIPLIMAVVVIQLKPILEFARNSKEISAAVKMVYPEWKSAEDLAVPLPLPGEAAPPGTPGTPGALPPDGQLPAPGGTPPAASPDSPVSSDGTATFSPTTGAPPASPSGQGVEPGSERGRLLH